MAGEQLRTESSPRRVWHPDIPSRLLVNLVMQTEAYLSDFLEPVPPDAMQPWAAPAYRVRGHVTAKDVLGLRNELDRVMDEVEAQYQPGK